MSHRYRFPSLLSALPAVVILSGMASLDAADVAPATADDRAAVSGFPQVTQFRLLRPHFRAFESGWSTDRLSAPPAGVEWISFQDLQPVQPQVQQPLAAPRSQTPAQRATMSRLFAGGAPRSNLRLASRPVARRTAADSVLGIEATFRAATDAGNLLGKSPRLRGLATQQRSPIITDIRVRGRRTGQLVASGSYWVPARIDLDTMLSKLDSHIVEEIEVISGPYSVLHGPGFSFIDVKLRESPRSAEGVQSGGSAILEYKTNGEQWHGRQRVWYADTDYGITFSYGHRTGSDYSIGGGNGEIPSSYKSRDLNLAIGFDLEEGGSLEFNYLRLDQTDVELPGQAFDIDVLVTDGFDVTWTLPGGDWYDRAVIEGWYNQTEFEGTLDPDRKQRLIPVFGVPIGNLGRVFGTTDVESLSTGYQARLAWDTADGGKLIAGTDLRFLRQDLEELVKPENDQDFTSSPIPRSYQADPGLFLQFNSNVECLGTLDAGLRFDWVGTDVLIDPDTMVGLPIGPLREKLGFANGDLNRDFQLWSGFVTVERELSERLNGSVGFGYSERPPTLTELYSAAPFLFLLQNGLNILSGAPGLKPSRLYQLDAGLEYQNLQFRGGIDGFHAWGRDVVTFDAENVDVFTTGGQQVDLKSVNAELVTLVDIESFCEVRLSECLTGFATLAWTQGTDRRRNAPGRITPAGETLPSKEPLPGISPLTSTCGLRLALPGHSCATREY
jgi:iron complex outermembrane receptor protein